MILEKIRVVPTNLPSIKRILINNKSVIKDWSIHKKPKCIGHKWCSDTHFQSKLEDIEIAHKIKNSNTNMVPLPDMDAMEDNILNTIKNFTEKLTLIT